MTAPPVTASLRWAAMGTTFEALLAGEDAEHLEAVLGALEDESRRLEGVLSRFDPASEISRVNRALRPVRLDVEVWGLLAACDDYRRRTDGYFDVTGGLGMELDPTARTVRRDSPAARIDLGGIGKGYALDRMAELLHEHGVASALLHAGTSSILAHGGPWPIAIGDRAGCPIAQVDLSSEGFSYSAVRRPGQEVSDVVDPLRKVSLDGDDACVVLAPNATLAEALSTSLLAMGRERAIGYLKDADWPSVRAAWIGRPPRLEWLKGTA